MRIRGCTGKVVADGTKARQDGERGVSKLADAGWQPDSLWPCTAAARENRLEVGGCDVVELARRYGTPLYVIDEYTVRDACRRYRMALLKHYPAPSAVYYAAKALLNTALVQLVSSEGVGLDVASSGELYIAAHAGAPPPRICFHGNAKTRVEIEQAVRLRVGRIVVDNLDEIDQIGAVARQAAVPVQISLCIAPEITFPTHSHVQTRHRESRFGLTLGAIEQAVHAVSKSPFLRVIGLHLHLGSQIVGTACYERAIGVARNIAVQLRDLGVEIEEFSLGGGIGVAYIEQDTGAAIDSFVEKIARSVKAAWGRDRLPQLVLGPGRSISARAGVALYTIVATRSLPDGGAARRHLHLDGGVADNIRPALYGARYRAVVLNRLSEVPDEVIHLSGCYCESGDVLVRDIQLPRTAQPGDLIAVPMASAHTLSMASNYNGARRPPVLLVADGKARTIQRRESFFDLVARDYPLTED